jgi:hypothetical protein
VYTDHSYFKASLADRHIGNLRISKEKYSSKIPRERVDAINVRPSFRLHSIFKTVGFSDSQKRTFGKVRRTHSRVTRDFGIVEKNGKFVRVLDFEYFANDSNSFRNACLL